ncbi:uncharacterized protein PAC_17347 [Phialocephala subalpina]|uniref:Uncharacterized protein n=1 Tax=Phialocephala subalpina TaxID=576137 RepID=A0A1L7XR65_9HELO|nr:uncharacterized protein PAC_17347 [Phialocephala subalpina]
MAEPSNSSGILFERSLANNPLHDDVAIHFRILSPPWQGPSLTYDEFISTSARELDSRHFVEDSYPAPSDSEGRWFFRRSVQGISRGDTVDCFNLLSDPRDEIVWNNNAGTVSFLRTPLGPRFVLQTPRDGGPFSFLDINSNASLQVCISPEGGAVENPGSSDIRGILYSSEAHEYLDTMAILPLIILREHVQYTSKELRELIRRVEKIENQVATASLASLDFNSIIRDLHLCNTKTVNLERRWGFQTNLAATRTYLSESDDFKRLHNDSIMQSRLSSASEYDLSVLPRRIQNQFSAIYNLIAQRDTKATIDVATNSHRIAKATLRDSSSMKTIAAMTLIFLPATFICSFFSMNFFDWRAGPSEDIVVSLWVYFVVAVPLTIVVISCWIFWTRRTRQKATLLPISENTSKKTV